MTEESFFKVSVSEEKKFLKSSVRTAVLVDDSKFLLLIFKVASMFYLLLIVYALASPESLQASLSVLPLGIQSLNVFQVSPARASPLLLSSSNNFIVSPTFTASETSFFYSFLVTVCKHLTLISLFNFVGFDSSDELDSHVLVVRRRQFERHLGAGASLPDAQLQVPSRFFVFLTVSNSL